MLQKLGLSDLDEEVYRHLLRGQADSLVELARGVDVGRRRLDASLQRLAELGLVRTATARIVPVPVHPDVAVHALIQRHHAELESVASRVSELSADYRVGAASEAPTRAVEVVVGRERVARRTSDLGATVETELLVFDTPPYSAHLGGEVERELPRLRRGVAIKAIYSAEALQIPERLSTVRMLVEHGEEARVLPTVPLKLAIFDRRTAVVPLASAEAATDSVALVHESGLLDAIVALFDTLWDLAPRLGAPSHTGSTSAADAELLSLLAAGVKDEAIARQLGVGVRTARRRITELMSKLNATSRFQAGLEACRRGWLS